MKRELLVAPGTDNLLFNQPLLDKVVSTIKEDSLISSTVSLASISKTASRELLAPVNMLLHWTFRGLAHLAIVDGPHRQLAAPINAHVGVEA